MPSDRREIRGGQSRRHFLTSVAALGSVAPLAAAEGAEPGITFAAVDDLGLDPALRADLEAFARPVLQEAGWLEELSLDEVDPAFVFVPRG
jgi:hypothetical protein